MSAFKEKCILLRHQGLTLSEIAVQTGRPKTSVYFHIRDIPLAEWKRKAVRKARGEHIRKYPLARRGKSTRNFKPVARWTPETVLLVSHLLFDGDIRRGACVYNNRNTVLVDRVEGLMRMFYAYPPSRYYNPDTKVRRISYFNVALAAHLQQRAAHLIDVIEGLGRAEQREFLRAFFDDEGCMDYRPGRRRVRGYQNDRDILYLAQRLLRNFGITAKVHRPNEVVISEVQSLRQFQKEINFSKGVCVNGGRSNSVWGSTKEKREILKQAIALPDH